MRYKSLILVCTLLVGSVASSALDERPFEEASFPGAETPAGKMLEKRIMAQALIDHGMDTSSPEAILVGVRILHENPVVNAQNAADQKSSEDQIQELKGLVEKAVEMRPDDKILAELASRIGSELEEKTRGLAGDSPWYSLLRLCRRCGRGTWRSSDQLHVQMPERSSGRYSADSRRESPSRFSAARRVTTVR